MGGRILQEGGVTADSVVFIRREKGELYRVWKQSSDADVCEGKPGKVCVGKDRAREYAETIADGCGIEVIGA